MVDGSLKLKFCFIFHIFTCTGVPFGGKPKTNKKKNKNVCLESVEWKIQQKKHQTICEYMKHKNHPMHFSPQYHGFMETLNSMHQDTETKVF